MKHPTLVERLENFLRAKADFVCGGELQKLAALKGYEPQNAGRRLREMVNDKILEVEYRKGQNKIPVAWYRYIPKQIVRSSYEVINGKAVLKQEKIFA